MKAHPAPPSSANPAPRSEQKQKRTKKFGGASSHQSRSLRPKVPPPVCLNQSFIPSFVQPSLHVCPANTHWAIFHFTLAAKFPKLLLLLSISILGLSAQTEGVCVCDRSQPKEQTVATLFVFCVYFAKVDSKSIHFYLFHYCWEHSDIKSAGLSKELQCALLKNSTA